VGRMLGPGPNLALLLLGSYRRLVDTALAELAVRGYADIRPVHDFALRAIDSGADNASELGRRMSVSKQAAAKTIAALMDRDYVTRASDPTDARRKRIEVTSRGRDVMRVGEAIFDEVRREWEARLGVEELAALEERLSAIVADAPVRVEAPGWVGTAV
jgi:DNA-binding MarR family transcriptional regulator